jgi:hypothetical protein
VSLKNFISRLHTPYSLGGWGCARARRLSFAGKQSGAGARLFPPAESVVQCPRSYAAQPSTAMSTKLAYKVGECCGAARLGGPAAAAASSTGRRPPTTCSLCPTRPATVNNLRPTTRTRFFKASRSDASIVHRDTCFLNLVTPPINSAWLNLICIFFNLLRTRHKIGCACRVSRHDRSDGRNASAAVEK